MRSVYDSLRPRFFHGVAHVSVCETQEFFGSIGRILAEGIAHAALNGDRKVPVHGQLVQFLLDTPHDGVRIFGGGIDQQRGEFVSAMPRYKIRGARGFHESVRNGAKDIIANGVPKAVVDVFQVQNIKDQQEYA
jgi:hypothetical protein